jgi:hypothetical protein
MNAWPPTPNGLPAGQHLGGQGKGRETLSVLFSPEPDQKKELPQIPPLRISGAR